MTKLIVVTDRIDDPSVEKEILGEDYQLVFLPDYKGSKRVEVLSEASALLVWHEFISKEFMESLTNCKMIMRYGAGFDNIDLEAAKQREIVVCNTPDYGVDEVADTASAFILNAIRQIGCLLYTSDAADE